MNQQTVIPARAIFDKQMPHATFRLLAYLSTIPGKKTSYADIGQAIGGNDRRNVIAMVKILTTLGYIIRTHHKRDDGGSDGNSFTVVYEVRS
jgi:hypothetical protein